MPESQGRLLVVAIDFHSNCVVKHCSEHGQQWTFGTKVKKLDKGLSRLCSLAVLLITQLISTIWVSLKKLSGGYPPPMSDDDDYESISDVHDQNNVNPGSTEGRKVPTATQVVTRSSDFGRNQSKRSDTFGSGKAKQTDSDSSSEGCICIQKIEYLVPLHNSWCYWGQQIERRT